MELEIKIKVRIQGLAPYKGNVPSLLQDVVGLPDDLEHVKIMVGDTDISNKVSPEEYEELIVACLDMEEEIIIRVKIQGILHKGHAPFPLPDGTWDPGWPDDIKELKVMVGDTDISAKISSEEYTEVIIACLDKLSTY